MDIVLHPIGYVHSSITASREDYWREVTSEIRLEDHLSADSLRGIEEYSHLEVLFYFHGVSEEKIVTASRHPRGNPEWPAVGIFAQRAKARPNRLGVTICELIAVDGLTIRVRGLDAFDGSPVVDIKPVLAEFLPQRSAIRQSKWSTELMKNYFASEL